MNTPRQWDLYSLFRLLVLYAVLVLYSLAYEYFYSDLLTPLIQDDFTAYDFSKSDVYTSIAFLTPLALLPMGTRLRAPGQFIVAALSVFMFIPIPIVFAAMVSTSEYWMVYLLLWVGFLALSTLSSMCVNFPLPQIDERTFKKALVVTSVFFGAGLLYVLATNRFSIVSLNQAHEERGYITISGLQGYLTVGYTASFGGLMAAMALMYRKYWALALALAGFVICYGTLEGRNSALMPAWIAYIYLGHRWFYRDSVSKLLLTLIAPFLVGIVAITIVGTTDRESFVYDAFTLANYRLFSVPAIGFNIYYNFFSNNPFTYWSHITFVGNFVSNPYGMTLGEVMEDAYHMGSYNGSFLETDSLAAAGVVTLPFISLVFGLVLLAVNSCMRGLNVTLLAVVTAGASIALIDTGIGPAVLSNGLAFLSVFMLFVPRGASWNLRNLNGP
jgi:hypothetical protein